MGRIAALLLALPSLVASVPVSPLGWSVEELDALMRAESSDKSSLGHGYVNAYGPLLGPWRQQVRTVLEIGIGAVKMVRTDGSPMHANMGTWLSSKTGSSYRPGASLRAWSGFFPNARVVGVDIDAEVVDAVNGAKMPRIEAIHGDTQQLVSFRTKLAAATIARGGCDIIIDDGLHSWSGQQQTLITLWPYLRHGGYYFVEDVFWTWGMDAWKAALASSNGALLDTIANEHACVALPSILPLASRGNASMKGPHPVPPSPWRLLWPLPDVCVWSNRYRIIESSHPLALPVGATHAQGSNPGALILLTKPTTTSGAVDELGAPDGGASGAGGAGGARCGTWTKVSSNLASIGQEVGRADSTCAGRHKTLSEAQKVTTHRRSPPLYNTCYDPDRCRSPAQPHARAHSYRRVSTRYARSRRAASSVSRVHRRRVCPIRRVAV